MVVCKINKNKFGKIIEKPTTNNLVVVGAYCFKNRLIKYIPKNTFFNMNDFIKKKLIIKEIKLEYTQFQDQIGKMLVSGHNILKQYLI